MNPSDKLLFGRKRVRSASLKSGLFLLLLQSMTLGTLLIAIPKLILQFSWPLLGLTLGFLLFLVALYLLSQNYTHPRQKEMQYIVFSLGLSLFFYPINYFLSGGILSGVPLLYILGAFATAVLLDSYAMFLAEGLMALSFFALLTVGYLHPSWITRVSNLGNYAYVLIPLTILYVGTIIGLALRMIYRNYRENQHMLEELLSQLEEAAVRDPLSGAYDRGFLMDTINRCIQEIQDGDLSTFSLILFDLDHFKVINDRYGHLAGDDCIRNLADLIRQNLRQDDIIARYGGEEFICVLPGATDITACQRADQIRHAVAEKPLSKLVDRPITISGGVAMYEPGRSARDMISLADRNLYTAKRRGRNRVVWRYGRTGLPAPTTDRNLTNSRNRRSTDSQEKDL